MKLLRFCQRRQVASPGVSVPLAYAHRNGRVAILSTLLVIHIDIVVEGWAVRTQSTNLSIL